MKKAYREILLEVTGGTEVFEVCKIQDLWSGYGTIKRFGVRDSEFKTLVVKHVCLRDRAAHPRGWNSDLSHQRKLKSYQVETEWYRKWSSNCSSRSYVPRCYATHFEESEFLMVFEDLDESGYPSRISQATNTHLKSCLKWLAHFHATFLGKSPEGLWDTGTYWHLDTRPDELNVLQDQDLKRAAKAIDQKLKNCSFQTFVHGDAKVANFCFSKDGKRVAAVDFQYVGGGCGMKDVAYFIGSCLDESECERQEEELLNYYFQILRDVLREKDRYFEIEALLSEWRSLYPVAWADFHRFLKGWSPGHWKINSYSERLTRQAIRDL